MFTSVLQPTHLLIILVVALVVLGPKRLPEAGRALGHGLRELRSSIGGGDEDERKTAETVGANPQETSSLATHDVSPG